MKRQTHRKPAKFGATFKTIDLGRYFNWPTRRAPDPWWRKLAAHVRKYPQGRQTAWGIPFRMADVGGPRVILAAEGGGDVAIRLRATADFLCVDVVSAPSLGYSALDVPLFTQESYVLRVVGNDGQIHFGVIRIDLLGFDQNGDAIMIFDWAYQLQAGNPDLVSPRGA